ncbi:MAG: hypothetical protein JST12_16805 [Armatimonadetes bacterium]|nr:hypothetical protein [Armatimonadota bacterium]MBS1703325.1 hypothetical protein [Armatimonadota bacterium]MBS1729098.1 hypothetical protein [Armatimonadota bacterium]
MAQQIKLAVGTMLEEKSTGKQLEIVEANDCAAASYGTYQYKLSPENPPIAYSNEIGPSPMQRFVVLK